MVKADSINTSLYITHDHETQNLVEEETGYNDVYIRLSVPSFICTSLNTDSRNQGLNTFNDIIGVSEVQMLQVLIWCK